jgi:hypothetical protein
MSSRSRKILFLTVSQVRMTRWERETEVAEDRNDTVGKGRIFCRMYWEFSHRKKLGEDKERLVRMYEGRKAETRIVILLMFVGVNSCMIQLDTAWFPSLAADNIWPTYQASGIRRRAVARAERPPQGTVVVWHRKCPNSQSMSAVGGEQEVTGIWRKLRRGNFHSLFLRKRSAKE